MANGTPATKAELVSLKNAIETIATEEERESYCRKMIWSRLLRIRNPEWRSQLYLMRELGDEISDTTAIGKWDSFQWCRYMMRFMDSVVIISEEYTIEDGYLKNDGVMKYTCRNGTVMEERLWAFTSTNDNDVEDGEDIEEYRGISMMRCIIEGTRDIWENPNIQSEVEVREFEDRYEEIIIPPHLEDMYHPILYDHLKKTKKVIYKRDLLRPETLRPIHEEMLYSLETPPWYINEARRAQQHFTELNQSQFNLNILF